MIVKVTRLSDPALVRRVARATIGLGAKDTLPLELFASMLDAGETPVRAMQILLELIDIPWCDHTHFLRHTLGALPPIADPEPFEPYVRTSRPDAPNPVKYDRRKAPQDTPITVTSMVNPQWFLSMSHLRLCENAGPEIVNETQAIKMALVASGDIYLQEIARQMMPMCEYRGGVCHSRKPCGLYPALK